MAYHEELKYLIIHGGKNEKEYLNDFYILKVDLLVWINIKIAGLFPK